MTAYYPTYDNVTNDTDMYDGNGTDSLSDRSILFYLILWTYVAPTVFGLITVIGTVGNGLVIYVISSRKNMQTVTNLLLFNLAIADISFLLICVPFTTYKYIANSWPFGDMVCKLVKYMLYVTSYVTVWTLVAVSALRYATIVYSISTANYRTKKNILLLVALIWIVTLTANIPTFLVHTTKTVRSYTYCGMHVGSIEPLFITFFIFAYALPLVLICFLYLLIMCHLREAGTASSLDQARVQERTTHACRVIFLVVVVFGLSWLPLHVNSLLATFGQLPDGVVYEYFRILWNCMAYGNSCANPIIYNYFSQDFRRSFREVLSCKGDNRRQTTSDRQCDTERQAMV